MYSHDTRQFNFSEFLLPFDGKLEAKNRWVQLSAIVPWQRFEKQYAALFSPDRGSPAKPFRMAFGALILKERLNCTDEELVEQFRENPYLQYFLGLEGFSNVAPLEASMLVHFRKRISLEMIGVVNESLVAGLRDKDNPPSDNEPPDSNISASAKKPETEDSAPTKYSDNNGQLILDAREKCETLVDLLYAECTQAKIKPRTYRKIARIKWLSLSQPHVRPIVLQ
jgi:transposase, IS5 family